MKKHTPKHYAVYEQQDWSTERMLRVHDETGKVIGEADPFWPFGIPASPRRWTRRIRTVAMHLVQMSYPPDKVFPGGGELREGRKVRIQFVMV